MSVAGLSARLNRLDRLQAMIADGEVRHVAELAVALAVSERTLARDLVVLRQRGIALESDIGRGGGVRLSRHARVGDTVLRETQAMELLLALTVSEVLGAGLVGNMAALRGTVARAFAPADRAGIARLRRRIWVASPVSEMARSSKRREQPASRAALQRAFFRFSVCNLTMQMARAASAAVVEAHYLLWAWPFWYVLSWDISRQATRTFRLDRIRNAVVLPANFQMRSAELF